MNDRKIHLTLLVGGADLLTDSDLRLFAKQAADEINHLGEVSSTVVPLFPEGLPIDDLRRALADYEDSVNDEPADLTADEVHTVMDVIRRLLHTVDAIDPFGLAQAVLDSHAIRPDWKRNGEQILNLMVEAIVAAVGTPVAATTTQAPGLTTVDRLQSFADDRELLDVVLSVLPMESAENPMPFVEVTQRISRMSGYNANEVRGALVALDSKGEAVVQHGAGWSRTERD